MKKLAIALALVLVFCVPAWAADIELESALIQSEFDDMCKELGFAISYTPLAPSAPLGILGFNIGVEVTTVDIKQGDSYWAKATTDTLPDVLPIPKLHVQKGLPLNIDVGLIYSKIPSTNVSLIGGEIKWAVLGGTPVTPAVAIRGSYTKLNGVDSLDLSTMGIDISVSKGFVIVTPYAGVGQLWITGEEKVDDITELEKAEETLTKVFAGIKVDPLPLISLTAEVDYAEIMSYSLRLSVNF